MSLELQPITYREACVFIAKHHRHHLPPHGYKFAIAVNNTESIVGVVTVGQPVARAFMDGYTAEVTRCCTDGSKNAASMLYQAAWRACRAMGYRRLVTYVLRSETGTSLRAAGWRVVGKAGGGTWNRPNTGRIRIDKHDTGPKTLWEQAA